MGDLVEYIGTRDDGEKPKDRTIRDWIAKEWSPLGKKSVEYIGYKGKTSTKTVYFDRMKDVEKEFWEDEK